eukprot:2041431-Pleurochrysis_carterae.AAC.1
MNWTSWPASFTGYGRVRRDNDGEVVRAVTHAAAGPVRAALLPYVNFKIYTFAVSQSRLRDAILLCHYLV